MDLANLKEDRNRYLPNGNRKKDVVDNIQAIKTEIEDFKYEAERAEREDYGRSRNSLWKKPKNV
jgi:ATP-dependent Clp protease ATP-binding subunit ClpB